MCGGGGRVSSHRLVDCGVCGAAKFTQRLTLVTDLDVGSTGGVGDEATQANRAAADIAGVAHTGGDGI